MKHFTKKLALLSLLAGMCGSAWADEVKTSVYSNDFESSSDWAAKGKTDGWTCNPGTTIANTFKSNVIGVGAGTGDMGLVSPSFSFGEDVTIVDVEMKFKMDACTSGKSSGIEFITSDVNINNGYVSKGTPFFAIGASASGNGYWGTITVGGTDYKSVLNQTGTFENNNLNRNTTGIVVLNVRFNFTTKVATYSMSKADGTALVQSTNVEFANTEAESLDRIFLHAGKTYGGVTVDDVKVYSVAIDEVTKTYSATFTENAGLNPTISIFSDETKETSVVNGLLEDGVTYYYTASLVGYYDYEGSFKVNGENPSVSFAMTAKPTFTYTVIAVDENQTPLATIASVTGFEGESKPLAWSKYINVDGTWYMTSENSFAVTVSETGEKTVVYEKSDIVYFIECENMNGVRSDRIVAEESANYSGNKKVRINNYYPTIYTDVFEDGGVFNLVLPYHNSNASGSTYQIRTRTADGTLTDVAEWTCGGGSKTYTLNDIVIPAGSSLAISCDGISGNSNARMDYLVLTRVTADVVVTEAGKMESNGKFYATFSSDKDLDFSAVEGLTAYYVTSASKKELSITPAETVPAGTAVLLEGAEAKTYQVPVCPSAAEATGNLLKVSDGTIVGNGTSIFVLGSTEKNGVGFYLKKKDSAIAAGKAYLEIEDDGTGEAKSFISLSGDDATAISNVEAAQGTGIIYNLNGQRVAAPVKGGLYIMNGKKVLVK